MRQHIAPNQEGSASIKQCKCGKEVECHRFTNTCECGRDYDTDGKCVTPIQKDQSFWVVHEGFSHLVTADVEVTEKTGRDISSDVQSFYWWEDKKGIAKVFGREIRLTWEHGLKRWFEVRK